MTNTVRSDMMQMSTKVDGNSLTYLGIRGERTNVMIRKFFKALFAPVSLSADEVIHITLVQIRAM